MKNSKTIITFSALALTFLLISCSNESKDEPNIIDEIPVTKTSYKETSKWINGGLTTWLVEDNRTDRETNDFKRLKEFSKIVPVGHNNYVGNTSTQGLFVIYNENTKDLWYSIFFSNTTTNYRYENHYKVLSTRIEDKDPEIIGALILTLESTNKTDKLEVMFIDKGVTGLVGSQKCLIQISGQQSDLSINQNEKNFYFCFSVYEPFKIVGKNIVKE